MSSEVLVALAALGGALLGGLGTVAATFLTNRAAVKLARDQRQRDAAEARYAEAKEVISSFLGTWWVTMHKSKSPINNSKNVAELAVIASRIQILFPSLAKRAGAVVLAAHRPEDEEYKGSYEEFVESARLELKKLEPKA